nr:LapA family protein [uncultured Desulfobacter sp.]
MLQKIKLISGLILVAITLVIFFQNTQAVETHFLFWTMTMPRAALLAITMLIGIFIGMLIAFTLSAKKRQ